MSNNIIILLIFISYYTNTKAFDIKDILSFPSFNSQNNNQENSKFTYLGKNIIKSGKTIIGYSDINGDKLTDIISYIYYPNSDSFNFFVDYYNKESSIFENETNIFNISLDLLFDKNNYLNEVIFSVRNIFVGSFFNNSGINYLISFNQNKNNNTEFLSHILIYSINNTYKFIKLEEIKSNIIIADLDGDSNLEILYYDISLKIRKILKFNNSWNNKQIIDFEDILGGTAEQTASNFRFISKNLSLKGGHAFIDIDGDCISDLIITHDDLKQKKRFIEIYLGTIINNSKKYFLLKENVISLDFDTPLKYGNFILSRVNNENDGSEFAPMLDMLIPLPKENKIMVFYNKIKSMYYWTDNYCETRGHISINQRVIFKNEKNTGDYEIFSLDVLSSKEENIKEEIETEFSDTIMRVGDFLGSSFPGILINQKVIYGNNGSVSNHVRLFKVLSSEEKESANIERNIFELYFDFNIESLVKETPTIPTFFDINENNKLGIIIMTKEKNSFFFNNTIIDESFYLKSKLINNNNFKYNTEPGTTFRYIVTNKSGNRRMDLAYQLAQTSDMSMSLPFSLIGIGSTNNYIEYFHIISNSYDINNSESLGNSKIITPIIPNSQILINKYKQNNTSKWNIELIVNPMKNSNLVLFTTLGIMVFFSLIIICLQIKDSKEEKKEIEKYKFNLL